ncbi:hypothetical protein ACTG9Q_31615 [Actinokineospora sp. 24-640]
MTEGDHGVVGELVSTDPTAGHIYVVRWDAGSEITTELPSRLIEPLDAHPAAEMPLPRRYAEFSPPGTWARIRSTISRAVLGTARRRVH